MATHALQPTISLLAETANSNWTSAFYAQLLKRAASLIRNDPSASRHCQPEDLIHDFYLRIAASQTPISVNDSAHALALATRIMRRILIDMARAAKTTKRFGHLKRTDLSPDLTFTPNRLPEAVCLRQLLGRYAKLNPRQARVAQLHFAAGKSVDEIGSLLRCSSRTIKRDLRHAVQELRSGWNFDAPAAQSDRHSCALGLPNRRKSTE